MQEIKPMQVIRPITFNTFGFARASVANYYDGDGQIVEAAADVLREGYNPTTLEFLGPIIEDEATNLLTYSCDLVAAGVAFSGSAALVTDAAIVLPDGTTGAEGINFPAFGLAQQSFTGGEYTVSMFLKLKSGSASNFAAIYGIGGGIQINLVTGAWSSSTPDIVFVQSQPNGWYRIGLTGTLGGNVIQYSKQPGLAASYWIWGQQAEAPQVSKIPTSFIFTGAATATRAADVQDVVPSVVSSNIAEDDYTLYNPATAYDFGEIAMVTGDVHRNYRSLVPGVGTNTGNTPNTSPTQWLDIGATNRWRIFDNDKGSDLQSFHVDTIDYTLSLDEPIDSIVFLNIEGISVRVTMTALGSIVYDETIDLVAPAEADWWSFFFGDYGQIATAVFNDFPTYEEYTIRFVVTAESGDTAKLGKAIIGNGVTLGFTEYGSSAGITDYSTKEVDEFGNYYVQERKFVGRADLKVVVDAGNEDFVRDTLASMRATPNVYIGHKDYKCTIIYGYYNDFSVVFSSSASSYCNLTLTGI